MLQSWNGGVLQFPFEGGEASSLSFGALSASTDIAEGTYVIGTISTQPELWGSMIFNEKDLDRHDSMEKSYLKILPGKIEQFVGRMQERVSMCLLGDGSIATSVTTDATAGGVITVDHPERFTIGELVVVDDGDSNPVNGYVRAINVNTGAVTLYDARTGGSAVNLSAYDIAQSCKVYLPAAQASGFTSLQSQLLSAANGGGSTIAGQTKVTYPHLQAVNVDGSTYTAATILQDLMNGFFSVHKLGKGNPTEILVSYGIFKNISQSLEANRNYVTSDKKAGFGFRSVSIMGVDGDLTITALRDMPDNVAYIMDWSALKFHGSRFFDRKRHLNGDEFFMVRATTGYSYIVDCRFYGDLVVSKPSHCGIIHSIPAACAA